jgi:Ca2+-binding EF-hand superfamily protein
MQTDRKRRLAKQSRVALQRKQTTRVLEAADPDKELRAAFDALDRDHNGVLTPEETQVGMASIGMDLPRDLIIRLVGRVSGTSPRSTQVNMDFKMFKQFFDFLVPLRDLFAKHDVDHSDSINPQELTSILREMMWDFGQEALEQLIRMVTSSSSGGVESDLDFQQFASLVVYLRDIASAFKKEDTDQSNSLSPAELQALLRVLGIALSVLEVDLHLKRIGAAGNISFETLIALLQSVRVNGESVKKQATMIRSETRRNLPHMPSATPSAGPSAPGGPPSLFPRRALGTAVPSARLLERKVTKMSIAAASSNNREAQQILEALKKTPGRKWEDPDFPAVSKSLYPTEPSKAAPITQWRRASELSSNPRLFVDTIDEGDVMQGALGDCWFLSALSVLATSPDDLVRNLFVGSYPEYGFYQVTIYKDGDWRVATVDDRIPCGASGRPYFASCRDPNEFWVPILEKAYAKLHGSYGAIESGNICDGLVDMTGESSEAMDIVATDQFWKTLVSAQQEGYLMGCSSAHGNRGVEEESPLGILQNHAYGVMQIHEIRGNRLLRVRNPWGSHEWKGRWSDGAKEWTPQLQQELHAVFGDDGSFFMCFDDFCQQFNRLYVLRMMSDDIGIKWMKQPLAGEWTAQTAGGCTNFPTWNQNPQYKVVNSGSKATRVFVSLRQPGSFFNARLFLRRSDRLVSSVRYPHAVGCWS